MGKEEKRGSRKAGSQQGSHTEEERGRGNKGSCKNK